ncbi:MAG TPA: response regulator transcription factor [Dehalococcoidales bacterium]|nr:response regulator transcription factor [Dehalococcoidales bacterium]
MRVLLIEDSQKTADFIKRGLEEEGFAVDAASSGEAGLLLADRNAYDIFVLDIMLPGKDGFEVCRILRGKGIAAPILMLTGRQEIADRVKGLNTGADDYLLKPFAFEELVARIRALLRREKQIIPEVLQAGTLVMNTATKQVALKRKFINLTAKEFEILEYLMRHPDKLVTRTMLEQHIWNQEFEGNTNLVDVYVKKLRDKLGAGGTKFIKTIRGSGYRLVIK